MKTRIYRINVTLQGATEIRLVEAATPAAAIRHVVNGMVDVSIPSTSEACLLVAKGIKVETAGEPQQQQ